MLLKANYQRWSRGHKARGLGQEHKKIRGQGPTFREQTLSRARTEILGAMIRTKDRNTRGHDKDQGHNAQVFLKKRSSKIIREASGVLQDENKNSHDFGQFSTN